GVLSGNVGRPGAGVNMMNWPWREIRTPELQAEAARTSRSRTLPVSRLGDALASATDPPVTTAFFMQSNLVNQMPDTPAIKTALSRLEFVICLDQFLTDTAETAHLFLPTTTFLEEEDLVPSYGHHWMQLMQPVAPPLGESRSDLTILQGLAERLGFGPDMAGTAGGWIDGASNAGRAGLSTGALRSPGARRSHLAPGHRGRSQGWLAQARPQHERADRAALHGGHGQRLQPELRPPGGRRPPRPPLAHGLTGADAASTVTPSAASRRSERRMPPKSVLELSFHRPVAMPMAGGGAMRLAPGRTTPRRVPQ